VGGDGPLCLTSVFSHGFLNVSLEQRTEKEEHIHWILVHILNVGRTVGVVH
jgi:hypothetical protein